MLYYLLQLILHLIDYYINNLIAFYSSCSICKTFHPFIDNTMWLEIHKHQVYMIALGISVEMLQYSFVLNLFKCIEYNSYRYEV